MVEENQIKNTHELPRASSPTDFMSGSFLERLFEPAFGKEGYYGLDIGETSLKVVRLGHTKGNILVEEMIYMPLGIDVTSEKETKTRHEYERVFQALESDTPNCNINISEPDMTVQILSLPQMPRKEMRRAVMWGMSKHMTFDVEESIIDFCPVHMPQSSPKKVLAVAVRLRTVQESMSAIRDAGGCVLGINIVPFAIENVIASGLAEMSGQGACAVIDMGAKHTTLCFFLGKELLFSRQISMGGADVTRSMTGSIVSAEKKFNLSLADAELLKRRYGLAVGPLKDAPEEFQGLGQISAMIRPVIERLVTEINRSFSYYESNVGPGSIQKIYLCGGAAKLKGLDIFLAGETGLEVEFLNLLAGSSKLHELNPGIMEEESKNELHEFTVAMGLALDRGKKINLVPKEMRPNIRRQVGAFALIFILAASIVLLTILWSVEALKITNYKSRLKELDVLRARLAPSADSLSALGTEQRKLREQTDILREMFVRRPRVGGILKEISWLVPDNIVLRSMSENGSVLYLEAMIIDESLKVDAGIADFLLLLSRSPFFLRADLIKRDKKAFRNEMKAEFFVECTMAY